MVDNTSTPADPRDQELAALRQQVADLQHQVATLQTHAAWARALISQFPDGRIVIYDRDLRYLEATSSGRVRGNATRDALVGRTIWEILPPDLIALLEGPYRAALAGQSSTFQMPFADGMYQIFVMPIRDDDEQIRSGMVISVDITARITAEQQLRVFQQLVEQTPYSIFFNPMEQQTITYANQAARALFGYGDAFIGLPFNAVLTPEAHLDMPTIAQQLETGQPWTGRHIYRRADGTTFPGAVLVFPMQGATATDTIVASIVRDVTSEEQAQQERDAQVQAAQAAIIRELATPLIPLERDVVVMPLVGALDSHRIQQVMEVLLEGIVAHEAETAILDITGVTVVDTQVAQGLLRATQAAKLLGTQVVLTGLGATIAVTLTSIGADLSGVITLGTLQDGITYAFQQRLSSSTRIA